MLGWDANVMYEVFHARDSPGWGPFVQIGIQSRSCELWLSSEHPLLLTSTTGTESLTLTCTCQSHDRRSVSDPVPGYFFISKEQEFSVVSGEGQNLTEPLGFYCQIQGLGKVAGWLPGNSNLLSREFSRYSFLRLGDWRRTDLLSYADLP